MTGADLLAVAIACALLFAAFAAIALGGAAVTALHDAAERLLCGAELDPEPVPAPDWRPAPAFDHARRPVQR